jgi:hypothetical protein
MKVEGSFVWIDSTGKSGPYPNIRIRTNNLGSQNSLLAKEL